MPFPRFLARWSALPACALLLTFTLPPQCALAQRSVEVTDPFAGIVQRQLANGLTVWFKRYPGAGTVSISLTVASGSDQDPPGREELAHVVEHALFATTEGATQEQLTRAVTDRGGSFNAATSPDRTLFWVSMAREHGAFALDWLYHVVAPRDFGPAIMPGVRDAVALEIGLAPRTLLGLVRDEYLLRPSLLPARFWQREFAMQPPEYRRMDRFAALRRISNDDVARFYQAHYSPSRMILLVAGDFDEAAAWEAVAATFGQLPAWPVTAGLVAHRLKPTPTRRYLWNLRDDVGYELDFRLESLSSDDFADLVFVQQLLQRRLMRRLRWSAEQAVYGVHSDIIQRGDVALLRLSAGIQPSAYADARSVIDDELQRLRQGRYPPGEFEQDRAALVQSLRLNQGAPAALRAWHAGSFYRPDRFPRPPLLGTRFDRATPESISRFARSRLGPSRAILSVERPLPLGQGGAALMLLAALLLGAHAARRLLLRPIDRRRLRYVARLHPPLALRIVLATVAGAVILVVLRLYAAGVQRLADPFVFGRDSFILPAAFLLVAIAVATVLILAVLACVPRKVLVFEHELRIKYLAYRSRSIRTEDLAEVRLARFADVWLDPRILRTVPLAFGWRRPGLLLRCHRGPDWFIAVRATAELALALQHLLPAPAEPSAQTLRTAR